jgi:hypothetical protein
MNSPTRSLLSPNASRIPTHNNPDITLNSPRSLSSQNAARLTTNIPETTVVSPQSISNRSELESSIHSLQSKILSIETSVTLSFVDKSYIIGCFGLIR